MKKEIVLAEDFLAVSRAYGCTDANIKSAERVAELYSDDIMREQVDVAIIRNTTGRGPFHPWLRLKQRMGTVRVIIDELEDMIIVYAAMPRLSDTYEDVVELWKQHRRRRDSG